MKRKLLIICGPTATGKTDLGIAMARKFNGEIVSCDSRQVYKWMDVGTGKDLPAGFEFQASNLIIDGKRIPYYTDGDIRVWGYDLVTPDYDFSVKEYIDIAKLVIEDIYKRDKLPILVGGTGLYMDNLVDLGNLINVPRNLKLREELSKKSSKDLFELLLARFPDVAKSMNDSDRANKRRLIRKLEILEHGGVELKSKKMEFKDILWIGLSAEREELSKRIEERVDKRVKIGFEKEVEFLLRKGYFKDAPFRTLGYKQWGKYLEGEMTRENAISEWKKEERAYAKRQNTWFRRNKKIVWFNVGAADFYFQVEEAIKK